jgi:hypothetical protein
MEKELKPVVEKANDGKVLIDKITLDNILERLANVEISAPIRKVTKIGNRTAKLHTIGDDKKIVKGYGKSWDKVDVGGKKYMMLEVFDVDGKKYEVEYLKFLEQGETIPVEIISIDKEIVEDTIGSVNPTKVDYDNYRTEVLDKEVPVIVTSVNYTYRLRMPDGSEITMPADALN